jgi:signal transduction histidine kinase
MDHVEKRELAILSEIGRIATSSVDLQPKLQRIIDVVMHGMGRDGASIFLIDRSGRSVTLTASSGLNQETVGTLTFPLGSGIAGWVAEQKVPLALLDPFSDPRFQYVPESGIERFRSLAAAPIMDEDRCLGVLFVLSAPEWNATTAEVTLLTTAANQISGVIKSTQLFQSIQERLGELATINEINIGLAATRDLGMLLPLITRSVTQALRAQGCALRLLDLPVRAADRTDIPALTVEDAVQDLDALFGSEIVDRTVRERRSFLISDSRTDPAFRDRTEGKIASLLSAPLIAHDRLIGVLTLYNRSDGHPFNENDLQFLITIASGAALALENAVMFLRVEHLAEEARTRAQEFSILYDVGTAMSATLNLDRLLRIILTAATMGGSGLGFNRAVLLLTNERTGTLQGMMGVGPTSWEEANRAWTEVARKHKGLLEWVQTGELFEARDTEINAIARGIRVLLAPDEGVLARTVLEKRPFNITNAGADPLVPGRLRDALKVDRFASVPLIAKDRVLGVILVDNLFTGRQITDHDIRFLTMFAHQAALTIDNAIAHTNMEALNRDIRIMHEQLAQSEKMAALGTMMAEITHEIRNPLVSIGGFTRRLGRKLTDPEAKRYLDIILSEVERLEGIIHDNLAYVKSVTPQFVRTDVNSLVNEVLVVYEDELRQRGIVLERQLAGGLPQLDIDPNQIKQVVVNLVTNAMEALGAGGMVLVRTTALADTRETAVEVADTGPGVSAEVMQNLFNPYYTTKVRGTGLGLPIALRIVKAHRGNIVFRNREQGGSLFTVTLPWPRAA